MAAFSKSTFNNMPTNSKSNSEIQRNATFNNAEVDFNKTFSPIQTSLASNLPHKTFYNSFRHFKKLKRKNTFHNSESHHKNKYSTLPLSMKSTKTQRTLFESKTVSNYKTKKHNFNKSNFANSYYDNLNERSSYDIESSFDTDFPDLKYIQLISKNKDISMSPVSNEQGQHISFTETVNNFITNNKRNTHFESSASSSSLDISQINFDSVGLKTKTNSELNLDEVLSDCSLSDILFLRKDGYSNNLSYSSAAIDTSHSMNFTPSQSPLISNVSLGISDDTSPQNPSNVIINIPDLSNDEQSQIEIDKQNCSINIEHFDVNQLNLLSNEVNLKESELIPKLKSKYSLINSISSESHSNHHKNTCTLKNITKNISHTISKTKKNKEKLKESNHSHLKTIEKIPDVLKIRKELDTKTCPSTSTITEDIGLQYSTDYNNCMVQLPSGAVVPSFLSILKPKYIKKLCVCGIGKEEIPEYWSESFHDILHLNFYKLCFIGRLPRNDTINFKYDDLSYKIVMLCVNHYNEENIKKSIKNVDDFVCLEYGIPKINIHSFKHSTYLAVLPNLKVIGYLEVEPIQKACILTHDEKYSKNIMPAKFGISKIWVLIKYRNKNVDINLLETFRLKEKLRKEDMAFSISGCQSVQFIKQYIGNENILVYIQE